MSVFVVRAFVKMRELPAGSRDLAKQVKEFEAKLTARLDVYEIAIVEVLQQMAVKILIIGLREGPFL